MKEPEFAYIADLLKMRSGLALTAEKIYLLDARLMPIARKNGFESLGALFAALKGSEMLVGQVVDAMTTNETSFFRDSHPFEALRKNVLPALLKRREAQRSLRIWSAASSTGQEAHSLAMVLFDDFPALADWRVEILGTDLSPTVLERAKEGLYSTFEVQRGMPVKLLLKHFEQVRDAWRVKDVLRKRTRFTQANLLKDLSPLGTFDIVFCRNVLIYFDRETKTRVLDAIAGRLAGDGALFLGGSESVFGVSDRFAEITGMRGVYRHADSRSTQAARPLTGNIATKVA